MADNLTLNAGSGGSTAATDDIGGVHYQRVKVNWGVDGSTVDASATDPLPVVQTGALNVGTLTSITNTVTVTGSGGTFPITDSGGSITVDNAALSVTGGGVEATALRVTIASDSTGVVSIDDNGGSITVDGTVAVSGTVAVTDNSGSLTVDAPVGTPVFVRLSDGISAVDTLPVSLATVPSHDVTNIGIFAVQASQVGPWTVDSVQSGTWTVQPGNTANTTAWLVTGTGGTFPVTDSGGSLTVDAPVGTPVFVRLSDGASAITTLPVSLASVPSHAVTNAGTFAVQVDGAALTALQLLDDVVVADDAAFTPATTKVSMAGFTFDDVSPDTVNEGDAGAARMSANRCIYVNIRDNAGNERGLNIDASGYLTANINGTPGTIPTASASGTGLTPLFDSDGDNTAQTIKGSSGRLYGLEVHNSNSADAWIQLFDESGAITVGTTTPKLSFLVPKGDGTNYGGMDKVFTIPIEFANSIKYACTTTPTGSGDPTVGLVVNALYR